MEQPHSEVVAIPPGEVDRAAPMRIPEPWISAESQQDGRGVHGERFTGLCGPIGFGVDRVREERHVVEHLIRICAGSQ